MPPNVGTTLVAKPLCIIQNKKIQMRILFPIIFICLTICSCSKKTTQINTIEVEPKGEYSKIKVEDQNSILEDLNSTIIEKQDQAAAKILKNPNNFSPPVLYSLSNYLFGKDEKYKAAFWFYTGQLRARYDANRCADKTAGQAVSILNENFGYQINEYGFADLSNLEKIVGEVIEFVKNNEELYDNQWINLHGMGVFLNEDKQLSKPKNEWQDIKNKTIEDYYSGFKDAIISMKK
jgi:hypothetical protein